MEQVQKENKMGVMSENRLLLSMSLPMMVSMLVQALYNVVDSVFVSRINENALTAVSLAFPVQNLMIAVAVGTAVGVNALLSRTLGEKQYEKAQKVADNAVFLAAACYIIFLIIGLVAVTPFYLSQTENAEILEYGKQYLTIVCVASPGVFMQTMFERLLQSTGKTFYTMITQGTGAIINIILDPLLIFGVGFFPEMGVAGAALATVIGQIVPAILAIYFNSRHNEYIRIVVRKIRPQAQIIKQIYAVGAPSIVVQAIGSVMTYGMNLILIAFTSTATAVFGVYYKLQSFIFMPVFGLNNGMVPIISYNYGAGKKERVIKIIKLSIGYAVAIMCVGFLLMQIVPDKLLLMFDASETMLAIGVPALRAISVSFLFAGFCIVCGSVFQALGNGVYSMLVSITRQLVVLLPVAYLLSKLGEIKYVWWAFPIAEIFSLMLSVFFMVCIYRKIIRHIGEKKLM